MKEAVIYTQEDITAMYLVTIVDMYIKAKVTDSSYNIHFVCIYDNILSLSSYKHA